MDNPIRWRKVGGGSFRMANGKIIKPNQVFTARIDEIPQGFRDIIVPVDELPTEPPLEIIPGLLQLRERERGWFDVVDGEGKVKNEKALRRDDAEELVRALNG